jgi:hypothetical protein
LEYIKKSNEREVSKKKTKKPQNASPLLGGAFVRKDPLKSVFEIDLS